METTIVVALIGAAGVVVAAIINACVQSKGNDTFDQVLAKVEKQRIENHDFEREFDDPDDYNEEDEVHKGEELYDCPEMFESRFALAICLTLKVMDSCYELQEPADEDARQFAQEYLGKTLTN